MPDFTALLTRHFPQLVEPALIKEINENGQLYEFEAGDVIMDYGAYVRMVPLIISGSIRVLREEEDDLREILLYFLSTGETCSMSFTCCMMRKQSQIRTEAAEATVLIGVPVALMDTWMTTYQSWKNFVMQTYDQKMMELVRVVDAVAFSKLDDRLWSYLQKRAALFESNTLQLTHQDIARDLNASREAISRLLKKLETQGKLSLGRNQIELRAS